MFYVYSFAWEKKIMNIVIKITGFVAYQLFLIRSSVISQDL